MLKKNREQIIKKPEQSLQEWEDYFDRLDQKPPRDLTWEQWEVESASMWQAVKQLDREDSRIFQALHSRGVYDYVGPRTVRLLGIEWRNGNVQGEKIPEPEGDADLAEVSIQMAHEIKDEELLVREKKDGVFFQGNGTVMQGHFRVQAPYKKAEFVRGVFYVMDELQAVQHHDGWEFRPHKFDKKKRASKEGMMVLWQGKEYKWKFYPTIEVEVEGGQYMGLNVRNLPAWLNQGVMEVYFSGERAVYVRERYHKTPSTYATWLQKSSLYFYRAKYGLGYSVPLELNDPVCWAHVSENEVRVYPLPDTVEQYELQQKGEEESQLKKEVVSVKGTFRYMNGDIAVIKEEHKVWDLVGGVVKSGETPETAFEREMQEELGVILPYERKAESLRVANFVLYRTYLYEINPSGYESKFHSSAGKSLVPWIRAYQQKMVKFKRTNIPSPARKLDMVDRQEEPIRHYQFDPDKYRQFCAMMQKYPDLVRRRVVPAQDQEVFFFGTYAIEKGKWNLHLDWEKIPEYLRCLWAYNNYQGTNLPFGLTKKKYEDWKRRVEKRCFLCGVRQDQSSICMACEGHFENG